MRLVQEVRTRQRATFVMLKTRFLGSKYYNLTFRNQRSWASSPITSWQIDGETVETMIDFIAADGDCSHEIKRRLCLGRKAMTNLDSLLKNRDITLLTKVHLVKAMVFPVVTYG